MFKRALALALALGALALSPAVSGLGGEKCVIFPHEHLLQPLSLLSKATSLAQTILGRSSTSTPRPFLIVSKYHGATPLVLDSEDDEAIHVAAHFFAADVERVTGTKPKIYNGTLPRGTERAIVVGSTGSGLVRAQHPSWTGEMEGRWEVWDLRVVSGEQVGGVKEALMVTGSNRVGLTIPALISSGKGTEAVGLQRGVIYGLYELSEQMGVSPWYWWADVPAVPRSTIAFDPTKICSHGEPTVKYRGLFINDELPVLWNWARETFEVPLPQTPFQVGMYERVFELLLRLKANYMWPASTFPPSPPPSLLL